MYSQLALDTYMGQHKEQQEQVSEDSVVRDYANFYTDKAILFNQ